MPKRYECIRGAAGSGKTRTMTARILDSLRLGKKVFVIVPEQEVMVAERRIADAADAASPQVSCEELNVLSFRRLADLAFRTYGGISYASPDEGARIVLMWQAIEEAAGNLKYYRGKRDRALLETLLSAIKELKRNGITAGDLTEAQTKLEQELNSPDAEEGTKELADKLGDLALILAHYNVLLEGSYNDPSDDISRLNKLLYKNKMFVGSHVYADSFNGFTSAEKDVVSHMIQQADSITVAICLPEPTPPTGFETVRETVSALDKLAAVHGIPASSRITTRVERSEELLGTDFIRLERAMRSINGAISEEDRLPADSAEKPTDGNAPQPPDAIEAVRPVDDFSEAEYAATRILALVENSARYRDIAIVGRGIERFKGILDTTLSRFGIPYFISSRRLISETPIFHVIHRALAVIEGSWQADDVLTYLKTGMTPLTADDINLLESYVTLWNISKSGWENEEWTMNPGGYVDTMTDEDDERLERLNVIKELVRDPLMRLSEAISSKTKYGYTDLKSACTALYEFIINLEIPERIVADTSEETATLYNTLIEMLDMLVLVGGELPVNVSVLSGILSLAADKTDYGALPETMDTVTVGDAALLRAGSVKHVIMLGCIDGVFPRAVSDDSFFSDDEKAKLETLDLATSPKTDLMNDDEIFYFYRSASSATKSLALSCPLQDTSGEEYQPSAGFMRAADLLSKNVSELKTYPSSFPIASRLYSSVNAAELYRGSAGTEAGAALKQALVSLGKGASLDFTFPLCDPSASLSKENADALYKNAISLTQYRLESFSNCPFKYYSKYVLKLTTPRKADFGASDVGNFIHRIMEKAAERLFDKNGMKPDAIETDVNVLVDEIAAEVEKGMLGKNARFTARLNALMRRLKRTSTLLVRSLLEEFSESSFIPSFEEISIGTGENCDVPPFTVSLPNGTTLSVYGKIDRVDTYKKGDDTYIRIVDYKTGSTTHSLNKIEKALDLQLLLYLFAIWKADPASLPGVLRETKGSIYPAGVLYQDAKYPSVNQSLPPDSTDVAIESALASLKHTGMVLNDPDIISAMAKNIKRYLPLDTDKTNAYKPTAGSMLLTLEEIGELMDKISDILAKVGCKLQSGIANAAPDLAEDACKYCDYKSVCRSAVTKP